MIFTLHDFKQMGKWLVDLFNTKSDQCTNTLQLPPQQEMDKF
jgi:hypothetical protein